MTDKKLQRLLVASPVHNRAWILPHFFDCLSKLDIEGLEVEYYFLENGSTDDSLKIVQERAEELPDKATVESVEYDLPPYDRAGGSTPPECYVRLCKIREQIKDKTVEGKFDYLFCIDSDILVRPDTLKRLLSHKLDFVAATIANPTGLPLFSNVNALRLHPGGKGNICNPPRWLSHVYEGKEVKEVGVTGAIFLASRKLLKDCSYHYIPEPGSKYDRAGKPSGEDMRFAISCMAKGYKQYLDECHRCWHVAQPELLNDYLEFKDKYPDDVVQIIADRAWLRITEEGVIPKPSG